MLTVSKNENKEIKYNAVSIYQSFYIGAFILKNLFTVCVFAVGLKSAI